MKRFVVVFVLASLAVAGMAPSCGGRTDKPVAPAPAVKPPKIAAGGEVAFMEDDKLDGMRIRLREVGAPRDEQPTLAVAPSTPLTDAETAKLLSRTSGFAAGIGDAQEFAMRPGSAPPPRTGKTVDVAFPPEAALKPPEVGKPGVLEVIRFAPEGDVPIAPHLSLTFSRPMVAVSSQEEAAKTVPATVTPQPAGSWRWLGARTLLFKPDGRFPMATDYAVEVPAGTASATGDKLKEALRFEFKTPPPTIVGKFPVYGPRDIDPVIFVEFDQKVEPAAIAETTRLKHDGKSTALRVATADEIAADTEVRELVARAEKGRFAALKAGAALPKGTHFEVEVRKGTPSAEGPKATEKDQSFEFYTYDPLKIVRSRCGWDDNCPPTQDWSIEFNNPLDAEAFDPAAIEIEPAVPGAVIRNWGDTINIGGMKQGRTRYTVTIPAATTDKFGQTLEKTERLTFEVGPAEETLFGPGKELVTLDPSGPPKLAIHSINHPKLKVRIHEVTPADYAAWNEWRRKYRYESTKPGPLPGKRVLDRTIAVAGEPDRLAQTFVDFSKYVKKGRGHFIVQVEPAKQPKEDWRRQEVLAWVQVTALGVAAFVDAREMLVWATRLGDGAAVAGAEAQLAPGSGIRGATDGAGLARLALGGDPDKAQILLVSTKDDAAFLPADEYAYWGGSGFQASPPSTEARWYAFDDRGLYRPGEDVRVKGWIRAWDPGVHGDVGALPQRPEKITWQLRDSRGNDVATGEVAVSALAGFHVALKLPKEINLGTAWLELTAQGAGGVANATFSHPIQIQEFRRPEFEVSADATPGPYLLGAEATATVSAKYFAGGGLPNAPVVWRAYAAPASYTPPNREGWEFGPWSPWWRFFDGGGSGGGGETATLEGKTDPIGDHRVGIRFEAVNPVRPMSVVAEATVTDVNRQAWTTRKELLVHPADLYLGLKTARGFYPKGDPIEVEAIAVDLDGKAAPGVALALRFARLESFFKAGEWTEKEMDVEECAVGSDAEPVQCSFHPKVGGTYRVEGTLRDAYGRKNRTELRLWVEGAEMPPARDIEQEKLTLVPEKEEYQPGETATFLVQAPFFPAEGVLTVRRSGLVREERFAMKGPTTRLSVPILEEHIPNVVVQVDVAGSAVRRDDKGQPREDLPRRVAYASGSLTFKVPPLSRTLKVEAAPRVKAIEPSGKTKIDVLVKGADGAPVKGAELVVVAADEAVLALTGYKLPDPIAVFYSARDAGVRDYHSRSQVLLTDPSALAVAESGRMAMNNAPMAQMAMPSAAPAPGGGEGSGGGPMRGVMMKAAESVADEEVSRERDKAPRESKKMASKGDMGGDDGGGAIAVRTNFDALALFAPEVVTDAKGKATVDITVPDSLTRYRIMVVAVEGGKRFGSGESNLTARLPLMARPSPPRFLNFGDAFELPIVLQNQTDQAMTVDVAVQATNVLVAKDEASAVPGTGRGGVTSAGRRVEVPANDRVEVRFPAASEMAGTARFEVVAASGAASDAARFELPVWTPATAEAFATYGEIDEGALIQKVRAPGEVWPQFGGLEITTSSTQLQALTDAVLYLVSYPFDCNEQIASRVLAIAALRDVLSAFAAEGLPEPKELEELVKKDLDRLAARQNNDGGFSFWRKGDEGWPYLTVHVASALARAKAKGYDVPPLMWERASRYLANIESHLPSWYSAESRWMIRAYALHVRNLMGAPDAKKAKALLDEAGMKKLSFESLGFLLPVLQAGGEAESVKQILRHMTNNAAETAGAAHFVTGYTDGAHVLLHSDRRVDGIVLEALILVDPKNDLIPKVVRGLLAHKVRGKWGNTQENAFVLLALDRYFNVYEKVTPDFVARVWLGDNFAGEHAFKGRTTERAQIDVPMRFVAERKGDQPLVLQKDGKGRLYYRIGMRYAPKSLDLEPVDYGFAVERKYEAIDDPGDVKRDADGTWRIKAGARVRVRLGMVAEARRYHVALVDPLPAGLEAVNPELATTEKLPIDQNQSDEAKLSTRYWWWWRPWYEHENMRDERVEAFTSLLWDGVYEYTYVARATTPGRFVVPPTRAEEMYSPETFGRSATDKVIVE